MCRFLHSEIKGVLKIAASCASNLNIQFELQCKLRNLNRRKSWTFEREREMAATVSSDSLVWLPSCDGETVEDAIVAGKADDGAELHIARAHVGDEIATGKLHIGHDCCYIPYGGAEEKVAEYEVLSNPGGIDITWLSASNGAVPVGAVVGGSGAQGEPIFIIRCAHEGEIIPGKLVSGLQKAFIPWAEEEYSHEEYEVLCVMYVKAESE